jgi:hypothetical protein
MRIAFAMGGLAGNNAHGAGFLQAALDRRVEPTMISCTSGQILWVGRYLRARRRAREGAIETDLLKKALQEDIRGVNPHGNATLAALRLLVFGKPGVFRPARGEYVRDAVANAWELARQIWTGRGGDVLLAQRWLELFPCRQLIPDFPRSFFAETADVLRGADDVGIAFNSYDPRSGEERVHLNERARELLEGKSPERNYAPGSRNDYRDRTSYHDIDADAVRDGLWLYQYGFERDGKGFVDGAYFRGVVLSELAVADRIYCVRPINHCWQGAMPRNYPELEDLKTEIAFDGAYCGERYQVRLVNKLLDALNASNPGKYHHVDLQEIEVRKPRGFFDYVFESVQVFDEAREDALARFDRLGQSRERRAGTG